MKRKLVFIFVLIGFNLYGQTDTWNVLYRVPSGNNKVMLRWMPPTASKWSLGIKNGYNIYRRYHNAAGGVDSTKLISPSIPPVLASDSSTAKWTAYWKPDSIVHKSLFYITTNKNLPTTIQSYADTLNNRYFYANILSDQNFKAAELCGLAFIDIGLIAGRKYSYKIEIKDTSESFITDSFALTTSALPDISLSLTGQKNKIKLEWVQNMDNYFGYDIEKSTNGGVSYTKLNSTPFINFSEDSLGTQKTIYYDSIPNTNATYYYRITGISYFGEKRTGTAKSITISKKLELAAGITRIITNSSSYILNWKYPIENPQSLPFNASTDLQNYTLGVSRKDKIILGSPDLKVISSTVNKIDTSYTLSKSTLQSLIDTSTTMQMIYFHLIANGVSGDTVYSLPFGYKPTIVDKIAPNSLTGLTISEPEAIQGKNLNKIKVSWNKTTDNAGGIGVLGYRVFRTIGTDIEKIEVSGGIRHQADGASRSLCYDTLSSNLDFKSIKYYVSAFDSMYNESAVATVTYLQKDTFKPLPAKIKTVEVLTGASSNQVKITFIPSPSKKSENIKHEIRRIEKGSSNPIVFTIPANSSATTYTDVSSQYGKTYFYYISAVDDSSNYSCDSMPSMIGPKGLPTQNGCFTKVSVTPLIAKTGRAGFTSFTQSYTESSKSLVLNWVYPSAQMSDTLGIKGFELYRTVYKGTTPTIVPYLDFISKGINTYSDQYIDFDSTYYYKIRAIFSDGSASPWGNVTSSLVKQSKLSLSKNSLTYEKAASSQSLTITSNVSWTVSSDVTWITFSASSGSNNGSINANVTANTGTVSRTGTITITGSGLTQTVSVEQFAPSIGTGITAQYYNYTSLSDIQTHVPNITRLENQVNLETGSSPVSGIYENFSVIWEGYLEVPNNGSYIFYFGADDGGNVYFDNKKIISSNFNEGVSTAQTLVAGQKYPIKIEYWDASGWASAKLYWSNNVGMTKQLISVPYLYPKYTPGANEGDPLHNECFVMRNPSTGKTFQTPGDYTFRELPFVYKNYQKWKFVKNGSYYNIISQIDAQNKSLQVVNDGNALYDKLTISYLGNKASEKWLVSNQGGNNYYIQRSGSTLYFGAGWDEYPRLFDGGQNVNLEPTECPNYASGIILDTDEIISDYKQQTKQIVLKSDVEWSSVNQSDWITLSPPYGMNNSTVSVMLGKNNDSTSRSGVIAFKSNNGAVNVRINQGPKPCLEVMNVGVSCSFKGVESVYIQGNSSFPDGRYEFRVDNSTEWKAYQWGISSLANGEHTLYVREKIKPTCMGSANFSVYCY